MLGVRNLLEQAQGQVSEELRYLSVLTKDVKKFKLITLFDTLGKCPKYTPVPPTSSGNVSVGQVRFSPPPVLLSNTIIFRLFSMAGFNGFSSAPYRTNEKNMSTKIIKSNE